MTSHPRRSWVVALACAAAVLAASSPGGSIHASGSQACDVPTRWMTLYAEELPPGPDGRIRLGWGLTPDSASIPGPLIEMWEGECLAITVVNNVSLETLEALRDDPVVGSQDAAMELGVSLHVHGVKYTTASDGTHHTGSWVAPGSARTFFWYAAPRTAGTRGVGSVGTAGYWWYHDHMVGTHHGTGGLASGLVGGLVVRRPGDVLPDRSFVVAMGPNATINLERYPDTQRFQAREGERVEFLVIGFGDEFHTFHLHGHAWADTRTGYLTHPADETRVIDNKTVGPADSFGFQIVAGESVGPGSWMLHCHVQFHSDAGMVTFFDVLPSGLAGLPLDLGSDGGSDPHAEH